MVGDTVRDLLAWISDLKALRRLGRRALDGVLFNAARMSSNSTPRARATWWRRNGWVCGKARGRKCGGGSRNRPRFYPGIPAALRRARPGDLFVQRDSWPDENEKDEKSLRTALMALPKFTPEEGRKAILEFERDHGERRAWVWARMGLSPLAVALEHLRTLAEHTALPLVGDSPDAMASGYVKSGYRADDAVLRALACVKTSDDVAAVQRGHPKYLSWLAG